MASLVTRAATPADYDHFTRMFLELGTPGLPAERARWEVELMPSTLFVERAGSVVGYGFAEVLGDLGYVRHVVVVPSVRSQGIGRLIMQALAARLAAQGCAEWCLNVKVDNTPAIRLYESLGMRAVYSSCGVRMPWAVLERLPREPHPVQVRSIAPSDDSPLEQSFALIHGQLTELRARGTWVLLQAVSEAEGTLGVACFDPDRPGCSPFRVRRPAVAAHLLEAARGHARPAHDYTTLFVENAPELEAVLETAGSELSMKIMHMTGPCGPFHCP